MPTFLAKERPVLKKAYRWETFGNTSSLEVNNPDTASCDVDEEVIILADVGVIDCEIIWQTDGRGGVAFLGGMKALAGEKWFYNEP